MSSATNEASQQSACLAPTGDLTIFEIAAFHQTVCGALSAGKTVTIDLHQVGKVDASALQLLIAASQSKQIAVTGHSEALLAQLAALGHIVRINVQSARPAAPDSRGFQDAP